MFMRILYATCILALSVALIGCTRDNNKSGKPGATGKTNVEYDVYPTEVIVLKPGESKDVKVSRKGKDLKDTDLTVTSSDPKVTVEGGKFKGDAKEATVTLKVAPDAPNAEHKITIKVGDVTKTVNLKVDKGGAAPPPGKT
jgi:hypothetical protein